MRIALLSLVLLACSEPAPPAEIETSAPARWDQNIVDMLPAIDACIARAPSAHAVTYAAPDHAAALVRLDGEEGKLDCRVDLDGANARISRTDPTLTVSGDGEAVFVRGTGENPGGECYEAPEVRDASGALIGWMLDPLGC